MENISFSRTLLLPLCSTANVWFLCVCAASSNAKRICQFVLHRISKRLFSLSIWTACRAWSDEFTEAQKQQQRNTWHAMSYAVCNELQHVSNIVIVWGFAKYGTPQWDGKFVASSSSTLTAVFKTMKASIARSRHILFSKCCVQYNNHDY